MVTYNNRGRGFTLAGSRIFGRIPTGARSGMTTLNKGFTLIELLVVLAIIALLSSVVFAALSSARMKARDAARIANAQQVVKALEMHGVETGVTALPGSGDMSSVGSGFVSKSTTDDPQYQGQSILAALALKGLFPSGAAMLDPIYGKDNYYLAQCAASSTYGVYLKVEQTSLQIASTTLTSQCGGTQAVSLGMNYLVSAGGVGVATSATGGGSGVAAGPTGVTWTMASSTNDGAIWNEVTYGLGKFVAVGGIGAATGLIMTSTDGVTWSSQTPAISNKSGATVAYGNNMFVAFTAGGGSGVSSMYSYDGIAWATSTVPSFGNRTSVVYGAGKFVAVANSGVACNPNCAITSTDGINWTLRTLPVTDWNSIAYGNGLFVAVGNDFFGPGFAATSTDGVTWSKFSTPNTFQGIAYGAGKFVAVSDTGAVRTSTDGSTWQNQTAPAANSWTSVSYGNGIFTAVSKSGSGNRVMTSPDGVTWTSRASAANSGWSSVVYGNDRWVSVADASGAAGRVQWAP